jgi:hypothetical protein
MLRMLVLPLLLLAGCAGPFPTRPDVAYYNNPTPMLIPQAPVTRPGMRALRPPPVAAPVCMTDLDHAALDAYLDQIEAWRGVRLK